MTSSILNHENQETCFIEPGPSSQNRIAIPTRNIIAPLSLSSFDDWSTSSEETENKQVVPQSNWQHIPERNNEAQVVSTFKRCKDVTNTTNTTHIYQQGVTVNKNFYCCNLPSIDHVLKYCITRCCIASFISTLVVILVIVIFSMWLSNLKTRNQQDFTSRRSDSEFDAKSITLTTQNTVSILPSLNSSSSLPTFTNLYDDTDSNYTDWKIILRKDWRAASYKKAPEKLVVPAKYIIISETETDPCSTQQECMKIIRNKQISQMKDGYDDIACNFLIGGDGMLYEGRGWDVAGHHVEFSSVDYDDNSIDLSFIGSFDIDRPTENQLQAAIELIEYGVENGKIDVDYKVKAHKQLTLVGDNPGDNLYNEIIKWKGWDTKTIRNFTVMEDYF